MDLAGEILKKRREDLGRDIREIADLLKIRTDYLRAIEEDAFDKLPAPVYTNGYIRCYARYLDIDAGPIVEHYARHLPQPRPSTIVPIAFSQKKSPTLSYAFLALLVAAALFFSVTYLRRGTLDRAAAVAPAKPQAAEAAPTVPVVIPEKGGEIAPETHTIEVFASEKSWMRLQFRDGRVAEVLLNPGESRDWSFSGRVLLKVGNAGGVQIRIDGTDLGSPGSRGQVLSVVLPRP
jgi:cytoskeleton protein RodZ